MNLSSFRIAKDSGFSLKDIPTDSTGKFSSKDEATDLMAENLEKMAKLQDKLFAQNRYALLIIFQAMDTAGKDGMIKHVMAGLNPQATQVFSFKKPSDEELDHDYLWRINKCVPERGRIGIFNRSHYEDVLVVRVHNLLKEQPFPLELANDDIWKTRYRQIRNFEEYLYENGIIPIKFFLHISKEEQKKRLLARIDDKSKNWKFSAGDIDEREYWDNYQFCYQEAIGHTSTEHCPWFVIPSDKKWYSRLLVSEAIVQTMEKLNLKYPEVSGEQEKMLLESKKRLLEE